MYMLVPITFRSSLLRGWGRVPSNGTFRAYVADCVLQPREFDRMRWQLQKHGIRWNATLFDECHLWIHDTDESISQHGSATFVMLVLLDSSRPLELYVAAVVLPFFDIRRFAAANTRLISQGCFPISAEDIDTVLTTQRPHIVSFPLWAVGIIALLALVVCGGLLVARLVR